MSELNVGLLLLRVVVGPVFAFHGYIKVARGDGLAGRAAWFESIGMRPGYLQARIAAYGLIATGVCVTVGFLTPVAGLGMVGIMVVAWWTVRRGHGLLVANGGWEYCLLLGAIGAVLAVVGPGGLSLDRVVGIDLHGAVGLLIAVGGGVTGAVLVLVLSYRRPTQTDDGISVTPAHEAVRGR